MEPSPPEEETFNESVDITNDLSFYRIHTYIIWFPLKLGTITFIINTLVNSLYLKTTY